MTPIGIQAMPAMMPAMKPAMGHRLVMTPFGLQLIDQDDLRRLLGPLNLHDDDDGRDSSSSDNTRVLYHQTDEDSARAIISSQQMYRGDSGLAGGAIYFAESPMETNAKAKRSGVVLRCTVELGRIKTVGSDGDPSATFSSLRREGYDSVCILGRASGTEYAVYNRSQVRDIRRA